MRPWFTLRTSREIGRLGECKVTMRRDEETAETRKRRSRANECLGGVRNFLRAFVASCERGPRDGEMKSRLACEHYVHGSAFGWQIAADFHAAIVYAKF